MNENPKSFTSFMFCTCFQNIHSQTNHVTYIFNQNIKLNNISVPMKVAAAGGPQPSKINSTYSKHKFLKTMTTYLINLDL